ncbi:hypothetical protein Nmel_011976 [Mimus melanotis]
MGAEITAGIGSPCRSDGSELLSAPPQHRAGARTGMELDLAAPGRLCQGCVGVLEPCLRAHCHCLLAACCTPLMFVIHIMIMKQHFSAVEVFQIICLLNKQMFHFFHIVTAAFYVNKDLIMISRFVYFKNQKVAKGSPSLRNLGTVWIVGCGALSATALCQLLLRNQQHSPAIPRNNEFQKALQSEEWPDSPGLGMGPKIPAAFPNSGLWAG